MEFLLIFALLVQLTASSNSTSAYPAIVFEKLGEIKPLVANYKIFRENDASLGRFVELFQQMNPLITKDVYNSTIDVIIQSVTKLEALYSHIQDGLSVEKQNNCFVSLKSFLDQIIVQSGFGVSNCIDISNPNVFNKTNDFYNELKETIDSIEKLPLVMFNPFVGRNVFTQAEVIASRIQELYDIEIQNDQETFDRLLEKQNMFAKHWHAEYFSVKMCVEDVEKTLINAHAAVQSQVSFCRTFNGK